MNNFLSGFVDELIKTAATRLYKELAKGTIGLEDLPFAVRDAVTDRGRATLEQVLEAGKPIPGRKGMKPLEGSASRQRGGKLHAGAIARWQGRPRIANTGWPYTADKHEIRMHELRQRADELRRTKKEGLSRKRPSASLLTRKKLLLGGAALASILGGYGLYRGLAGRKQEKNAAAIPGQPKPFANTQMPNPIKPPTPYKAPTFRPPPGLKAPRLKVTSPWKRPAAQ